MKLNLFFLTMECLMHIGVICWVVYYFTSFALLGAVEWGILAGITGCIMSGMVRGVLQCLRMEAL
jgi:hypothetical protein